MTVFNRTYELDSDLQVSDALGRVADLLRQEGVRHTATDRAIFSSRTPMAVLAFQPLMYSRKNWLGLNPFAHVSGLRISATGPTRSGTRVHVEIDRARAWFLAGTWLCLGAIVLWGGISAGAPAAAMLILAAAVGLIAWVEVELLGTKLVVGEIAHVLAARIVEAAA